MHNAAPGKRLLGELEASPVSSLFLMGIAGIRPGFSFTIVASDIHEVFGAMQRPTGSAALTARAEGNKAEQGGILPTPPPFAPRRR